MYSEFNSHDLLAKRIHSVHQSFIREILKVAIDPSVISFAGGLPDKDLFPVDALKLASVTVFDTYGPEALQYSNTEGLLELRKYIVGRYKLKYNLDIPVECILITNGSQQAIDLLSRILLDDQDNVIIEMPGYLGAIQSLSMARVRFCPVTVSDGGIDIDSFRHCVNHNKPKLFYTCPNFQNPSGITYSLENRIAVANIIKGKPVILIEDDPYGDLRFEGKPLPSFMEFARENTVLLGTFSKTIAPGFRIGWMVAPAWLIEKAIIAKQASDLHTNSFSQKILYQYLIDNDLDAHITKIIASYKAKRDKMLHNLSVLFDNNTRYTKPDGGMFLWITLPDTVSSMELFQVAIRDKVAFVPGNAFYIDNKNTNTMRLNFSYVDDCKISEGITRLAAAMKKLNR